MGTGGTFQTKQDAPTQTALLDSDSGPRGGRFIDIDPLSIALAASMAMRAGRVLHGAPIQDDWANFERRSMSTPTQRTLSKLRAEGWPLVQITERWNPFAKVRNDLFGFVDVLACRGDSTLAVQTTSGANLAARFEKMRLLPSVEHWLASASRFIVIHGWAKRGERGQRKMWTCREVWVVLGEKGLELRET